MGTMPASSNCRRKDSVCLHVGRHTEVSEEGLVALRMSHDGHDAGVQQLPQEGLGVPADVEAGEFEKHVGAGIDGVGGGAVEQGANVVAADVDFAATTLAP